jgi:hypothetical protein
LARIAGLCTITRPNGLLVNDEAAEVADFNDTPGLQAFISNRSLAGTTDVMVRRGSNWVVAVHCVGEDHAYRAAGYLAAYKELSRE